MTNPFESARSALDAFIKDADNIARVESVGDLIADVYRAGGKVLACGNGGSACDAMHLCEELTGRFREDRRALAAIACVDPGHLTCTGNDYGFEFVFSRWVEALGQPGDVLIALSTSGNSANVVRAVEAAQHRGLLTVALLGRDGGQMAGICDHEWIVAGEGNGGGSDRIQEIHMVILHALVERVEASLFG
jgi:D-sedoheptulose 7-phosphate isomerase